MPESGSRDESSRSIPSTVGQKSLEGFGIISAGSHIRAPALEFTLQRAEPEGLEQVRARTLKREFQRWRMGGNGVQSNFDPRY